MDPNNPFAPPGSVDVPLELDLERVAQVRETSVAPPVQSRGRLERVRREHIRAEAGVRAAGTLLVLQGAAIGGIAAFSADPEIRTFARWGWASLRS